MSARRVQKTFFGTSAASNFRKLGNFENFVRKGRDPFFQGKWRRFGKM